MGHPPVIVFMGRLAKELVQSPRRGDADVGLVRAIRGFFSGFHHGVQTGGRERESREAMLQAQESSKRMVNIAAAAKKTSAMESLRSLGWFALIMALLVGGVSLWDYLDELGYIHHDKMTQVSSKGWTNGEYKDCSSVNAKPEEPYLECAGFLGGEAKEFKVRFYGQTRVADKPENYMFTWKCRKNGDTDPTITCERGNQQ
jgi:hypothetical protein